MTWSKSCSWCHEMNEMLPERRTWCHSCGHRADLPRHCCDCQRCLSPQTERILRELADALTEMEKGGDQ